MPLMLLGSIPSNHQHTSLHKNFCSVPARSRIGRRHALGFWPAYSADAVSLRRRTSTPVLFRTLPAFPAAVPPPSRSAPPCPTPALIPACCRPDFELRRHLSPSKPGVQWPRTMVHFKNRYMVMEVFTDASRGESDPIILTQFNITKAVRDSIQLNFGECGLAASLGSLQVKYVNPVTKLCVLRVSREDHQKVWAAITMVGGIGKVPVSFNLLDVSGTIRACKKAALACEEAKFEQYKLAAGARVTPEIIESMQSCFDKIKGLEN